MAKSAPKPHRKPASRKASRSKKTRRSAPPVRKPRPKFQSQDGVLVPPSFASVVAAFAHERTVKLDKGWGATNAVLKVKEKIFAMTVRGSFVAKLPKSRVDELVRTRVGQPFEPRPEHFMKEWIQVQDVSPAWVELAQEAYRFARAGKV